MPMSSAAVDPPLPSPPLTMSHPSSSQTTPENQYQTFKSIVEFLQTQNTELHASMQHLTLSLNQAQTAFQNHITAQMVAMQDNLLVAMTQRLPPPLSQPLITLAPLTFGTLPYPAIQSSPGTTACTWSDMDSNTNTRFQTHTTFHDSYTYKPPKIDLPRFTGEDAIGWLAMVDRYIRSYRIPPHERVQAISANFGANAFVWMNSLEQRRPYITWESFMVAFLEHFG
ncbi:hypothetical protein ACLB2K_017093 [Fragaria x ananassa]